MSRWSAGRSRSTAARTQGYGRQGGKTEAFRGSEYVVEFVPKLRVEVVVPDADVDDAI